MGILSQIYANLTGGQLAGYAVRAGGGDVDDGVSSGFFCGMLVGIGAFAVRVAAGITSGERGPTVSLSGSSSAKAS